MGVFDNLDTVKTFEQSKYFEDGRYIVAIEAVKFLSGGFKGDSFVIETRILGAQGTGPGAPVAGDSASHVWNCSGNKREIGQATWLSFLKAVFGKSEIEGMTGDQLKGLSAKIIDQGALNGTKVYLEVWTKETQAGNPFTMHSWKRKATEADLAEFELAG
jgi:hypothetical protein